MSGAEGEKIPRPAILGAAALLIAAILGAAGARMTGVGTVQVPPSAVVESRALTFEDAADGSVLVRDAGKEDVLYVVAPGTNGFLRGVLRGLARERKLRNIGSGPAFVLTRWADGRMTLEDPETDRRLYLGPFGAANVEVFVRLLQADEPPVAGGGTEATTAAAGAAAPQR